MNENLPADVRCVLRRLRRRFIAGVLLENLAGSALIVAAALVVLAGVNRWLFAIAPLDSWTFAGAGMATIMLALMSTFADWPSLERVAAMIDRRGQTRDRLVSALAFVKGPRAGPMQELAERECAAFVAREKFAPLIPLRPPELAPWLIVPLVALAFVHWDYQNADVARREEAAAAQAHLALTIHQLEQLAQRAAKATEESPGTELRRFAEELHQSAERLRAETGVAAAEKAAKREISALEELIKELQRQPSMSDEMKALAEALAAAPGMKEVLDALHRNQLAAAAKALDDAVKEQLHESPQASDQQVRDALAKAMERLSQQQQLSAALEKLAAQMRAQTGNLTSAGMQQLREMIQRKQQRGDPGQNRATGSPQMTLQELITALENMKFDGGEAGGPPNSKGAGPDSNPQVSMEAFGASTTGGARSAEARQPAGAPGNERDFVTTASPFGSESEPAEKGGELALKGVLADGESLSLMIPTAGDASRSTRRYRELYEALAPAAEDAVHQENIPLGSRFLIKRYFESIRPLE